VNQVGLIEKATRRRHISPNRGGFQQILSSDGLQAYDSGELFRIQSDGFPKTTVELTDAKKSCGSQLANRPLALFRSDNRRSFDHGLIDPRVGGQGLKQQF
jgi:hypothetical protein